MTASYSISSYGGIGDENPSEASEKKLTHNLSGSCHELTITIKERTIKLLIDMGGYQGRGGLERNMTEISDDIHTVLLTHPHMDHIGEYPHAFVEDSRFEGKVYATHGTKKSAEIALRDAAKIMARDFEARQGGYQDMLKDIAGALLTLKKGRPGQKKVAKNNKGDRMGKTNDQGKGRIDTENAHAVLEKYTVNKDASAGEYKEQMKQFKPEKPAYGLDEVLEAMSHIDVHTIGNGWKDIVPGEIAFRFYNAGHIIGSVSPLIRITHEGKHKYILFSGDLGSYKWDIHPTGLPVPPHNYPIDTVYVESTYGNKVRTDFERGLEDFQSDLENDLEKYNQVIISTFAMDRTQNLLYRLVQMKREGRIDADIILDSPAGIKHTMNYIQETARPDATMHMEHAPSIHRSLRADFIARETELLAEFNHNINPENGYYTIVDKNTPTSDSKKKKIILTSSGMADGGMVISHLEKNITDPEMVFYFPGYLVPGTLGHALANETQPGGQQKRVLINGKQYEVQARMKQFNFLSGHGDAEDIEAWLSSLNLRKGSTIVAVHGDVNGSSLEFKHRLERSGKFPGVNIKVPNIGDVHTVEFAPTKKKLPASKKGVEKV